MSETRNTAQKLKILEHLRSVKSHPTAEEVYKAVRRELPTISLATVYRNLNMLAERGEILRFEVNKEFHFDGDTCNHQHCVCKNCGRIIDLFQKEISDYAMDKIKARGFKPQCVNIMFKGLCKKCRR